MEIFIEMSELKDLFENGRWYHCFRYDGLVSNGTYDVEQYLPYYCFDENYTGQTVLDVGCADGYFSLWMKERGAARVCAVDSNKYDGSVAIDASQLNIKAYQQKYQTYEDDFKKFRTVYKKYGLRNANKLLLMGKLKGLDIEYHSGTIYDLKPYGEFDVVLCNDLLEHLRDPITAIEQLYLATKMKCILTVSSAMKSTWLTKGRPILTYQGHLSGGSFYSLSEAAVEAMCRMTGFKDIKVVSRFEMSNRMGLTKNNHFVVHATK